MRNGLAAMLGLSEHKVRLVTPFIGGGFGPKIMMFYPEEVLIPWLAMRLDRPVKWIEDRAENFEDALAIPGLEILEIPLKPSRLWELAEESQAR